MINIKNLIKLFPSYMGLWRDVQNQKKFVSKVLEPDIRAAGNSNDGSLDEEDFHKIRSYYGFGVPAIVGEGICTLRGKPMSERERITSTCQGALTGLYDDFFDKTKQGKEEIRKMMDEPLSFEATTSLEKLFIHFLSRVHENLHDKEFFTLSFNHVFQAQLDSGNQLNENISREDIREITFRKGGHSLLFYRSAFAHKMQEGEKEVLFNAGSLMQLGNDIFDVYKDEQQNISTLVTKCDNIAEVRDIFTEQMNKTIGLLKQSGFRDKDKSKFLHKLVLGISRCLVCLDQLEGLQKKTGGQFIPSGYSREEMICDMEKPANMLRSVRYYLGYKF